MKKYINKPLYLLCFFGLLLAVLSACKKTLELPDDTAATALNFFPATDVMLTAYNGGTTAIQVDTFNRHPKLPFTGDNIPAFGFSAGSAGGFPAVDSRYGDYMTFANYNYRGNGHRLFFTDTANVVQLDTTINFQPQSYTCIYLADVPVSAQNLPVRYKAFAITEERAGVPLNKVGVRFIHLSPDAGSLNVSLLKADGSLSALLPGSIGYGQASAYQYLDSTAVVSGLVKFSVNNSTNGAAVLTGVAFTPGHSYIVLVTGFLSDQQRQVRSGTNPDGSTKYKFVTINRNLRAIIRKSY